MKKLFFNLIIIMLLTFLLYGIAFPWSETTHTNLSKYAAEASVLNLTKGNYLKNLGFEEALKTKFKWFKEQTIKQWLSEGARLEDKYTKWNILTNHARFNNHFHNPLKPWDEAGLNDTFMLIPFTGISSIKWAQDGAYQAGFTGGDWSWQKVREYYYLALTSRTEEERQEYFARVFMGLGHQMHLVQDAAVPAHVRNDK